MKPAPYVSLAILILACFSAYSQNDSSFLARAAHSLQKQTTARPVEKVYLHLDRPHYAISDTIWFKAYAVVGEKHQLSALSGVLYAELINQKDSVVKRLTLPLMSGVSWGDFVMSRSYKQGSYHIRAYTNYMRNAGTDYFYNQRVQVGGLQLSPAPAKSAVTLNPDVQFFPEGGGLVNGVRSRLAVKAVNANGLGQDIKGTIEDNEGNVVTDFATQRLGMGVFALTPQSGKTYKAKISGAGESGFTVDLPRAMEEGFTLALNNSLKDSIFIKVAVNEKLFNDQRNTVFYIAAQEGGKIYYASQGKLEGLVYTAKVEKSRFPTGIVQFTLFSASGEPRAERIAFVQNNDTLKLNITTQARTYTTRQKVKIDLDTKNGANQPVTGIFSAAVINESRIGVEETAESTILNNLLLTSDLKGTIEKPNYYFINPNEQTRADLDVLMLTQGYRRFEWKEVLNNTSPSITYQPEKALELSGTLKTGSGKTAPNGKITLMSTKDKLVRDTTTDINGDFKFTDLYLSDTSKIILRARKAHNGSNVSIYVKQQDYPSVLKQNKTTAITNLPPELAAIMQKNYAEYQQQQKYDSLINRKQLKEVVINARKIAKPDMYNHYGTVLEYDVDMKRLADQNFRMTDALAMDFMKVTGNHMPWQFIIDGFLHEKSDLNFFSPSEVESIRLIDATAFTPAMVILTTKRYAGTDTAAMVKLKQVNINAKKVDPYLARSSNIHGGGDADQVIMGDKFSGCANLSDCLTGKIFGVDVSTGAPFNTRGLRGRMSVIVDGVIQNGTHLNDVVTTDVYSVEVLRSGAAKTIYGTSIEKGGALIITMKHGGEDSERIAADTTVLKQVNVNAKKIAKKPEPTNSGNLNGPGNADQVIMGDKIEGCVTLSDCLNGKIFGVSFDQNGVPHTIRSQNRLSGPLAMVLIVDGNLMDGSHLNELNANDISSIEVLRSGSYLAVYGSNAPGGALVITTKRGAGSNYVTSETPAGLITYPFSGFYKSRTFYAPKYDSPKTSAQIPDLRNTVYWKPNIITDKDGKASFEYFNADTKGVYRVVVEGIDDNGNLGRQVFRYKVE